MRWPALCLKKGTDEKAMNQYAFECGSAVLVDFNEKLIPAPSYLHLRESKTTGAKRLAVLTIAERRSVSFFSCLFFTLPCLQLAHHEIAVAADGTIIYLPLINRGALEQENEIDVESKITYCWCGAGK